MSEPEREAKINAKAYAAVAEQWSAEEIEHCGVSIRDVVAVAVEASGALSLAEENARLREALVRAERTLTYEISSHCADVGMPPEEAAEHVATHETLQAIRAAHKNDPQAAAGQVSSTTSEKAE